MQSLVYIQRRQLYYSTVFCIRQHKIADFATREGAPLPSPKGTASPGTGEVARSARGGAGGPAGPDEGVSFRAADHKRAAEQEAPLSKGAVRAADWGIPAALRERAHPREAAGIPPASQARPPPFDKGGFWALPVHSVTNFFTIPSSSKKIQLGMVPCSTASIASSKSNHFT